VYLREPTSNGRRWREREWERDKEKGMGGREGGKGREIELSHVFNPTLTTDP